MITVCDIKIKSDSSAEKLPSKIEYRLHLPKGSVESVRIIKESLDARKKPEIYKVYSCEVITRLSDDEIEAACERYGVRCVKGERKSAKFDDFMELYGFKPGRFKSGPICAEGDTFNRRPIVVGFGPCGMFAALALAKMGLKPIVLERGGCMEERVAAVESFWNGGKLDFESNVQFGEGGAGTFSDGKLTTGTKSEFRDFILETFVDAGASPRILYQQKPHIGSDVLRNVVVNIRKEIESLGGEVRFHSKFESLILEGNEVKGLKLSDGSVIETACVLLCPGHSARDTVRGLNKAGVVMEQKPFSMGVRIEHPQKMIDISQYGTTHEEAGLEPAAYKLNVRTKDGRGVYTFCMCPGGFVVNASSHEGMVVTNGMSNSDRSEKTANSGFLADVRTEDFGSDDVLAGIAFQEKYERLAFECGGSNYTVPKETLREFKKDSSLIKKCLPDFVWSALCEAAPLMDRKLKGFDSPDAAIYGIESRSSSPVRIKREEDGNAVGIKGLYPCGEGAGYAGGIMSAAADGIKTAFKAFGKFNLTEKA